MTYYLSISVIPFIITNCTPNIKITELHSSFRLISPFYKTYISMVTRNYKKAKIQQNALKLFMLIDVGKYIVNLLQW